MMKGEMVRATLAGIKTNTRRIITPHNSLLDGHPWPRKGHLAAENFDWSQGWIDPGPSPAGNPGPYLKLPHKTDETVHRVYPRWSPGDRIWIKETWKPQNDPDLFMCVEYRADSGRVKPSIDDDNIGFRFENMCAAAERGEKNPWRSAMLMPRWAARLILGVNAIVEPERLQDINDDDALAEGFVKLPATGRVVFKKGDQYLGATWPNARKAFEELWSSINGPESWALNPWVWRIPFKIEGASK